MNYQTYKPHKDLESIVKFYWTMEVPFDPKNQKQKIVPDGCIEMTFNFGDKIKRYISETDFIVHPNAMVMGQRTKSFDILPVGNVDTFAICFYPIGFANFVKMPLANLVDSETPISELFGQVEADILEQQMIQAINTRQRIEIVETFLLKILSEKNTISNIVKTTVEALLKTNGTTPINVLLNDDISKRRQLERHFKKQIGIRNRFKKLSIIVNGSELTPYTKADKGQHSDMWLPDSNMVVIELPDNAQIEPEAIVNINSREYGSITHKWIVTIRQGVR